MKLSFTIFSKNYLAKVLGDSHLKLQPNNKFIIGLLDELGLNIATVYS